MLRSFELATEDIEHGYDESHLHGSNERNATDLNVGIKQEKRNLLKSISIIMEKILCVYYHLILLTECGLTIF